MNFFIHHKCTDTVQMATCEKTRRSTKQDCGLLVQTLGSQHKVLHILGNEGFFTTQIKSYIEWVGRGRLLGLRSKIKVFKEIFQFSIFITEIQRQSSPSKKFKFQGLGFRSRLQTFLTSILGLIPGLLQDIPLANLHYRLQRPISTTSVDGRNIVCITGSKPIMWHN